MSTARPLFQELVRGGSLSREQTRTLFDSLMEGAIEPPLIAGLLTALAMKGETVDEIVGAAEAMRARVTPVQPPPGVDILDTCSTGGDGKPTFNVSTTVAIIAAAAGATVAKHGNRSNVRPSGSAEAIQALGVNIDASVPQLERCLAEARIAFLYAIQLHPAMKHAAPVRKALGVRTIFNLIGPLTNPAGAQRQVVGVNQAQRVELIAEALLTLGVHRAVVTHGLDGLCDLSLSAPSEVAWVDGGLIRRERVEPSSLGFAPAPIEALFVDSPTTSSAVIRRVLAGEPGPAADMAVLNAAPALWAAGLVADLAEGVERAREQLNNGAADDVLRTWCSLSHSVND